VRQRVTPTRQRHQRPAALPLPRYAIRARRGMLAAAVERSGAGRGRHIAGWRNPGALFCSCFLLFWATPRTLALPYSHQTRRVVGTSIQYVRRKYIMRSLLYASSAPFLLPEAELLEILRISQSNNARLDTTGMVGTV
jgi:hypothetical protein